MEHQVTRKNIDGDIVAAANPGAVKFGPESAEVSYEVVAFYNFTELTESDLPSIKEQILNLGAELRVGGLILLSPEGINATISAPMMDNRAASNLREFLTRLDHLVPVHGIETKWSYAIKAPFRRLKVDLRKELITYYGVKPSERTKATSLTPKEWHQLISSGKDCTIIDTRNRYETQLGMFEGAVDPSIQIFTELKDRFATQPPPRDKPVLLYCTGGIRCEKAVEALAEEGYDNVYQLEGGILKYIEEYPNGLFKGECFVFDHRVSVDQQLKPSEKYSLCPHCGDPGDLRIHCQECGEPKVICNGCHNEESIYCSKNCKYQHQVLKRLSKRSKSPPGEITNY